MKFSELSQEAQKIISELFYMTVSSVNEDGTPWISPVYFNYDDQCNLYWISYREAVHSHNVSRTKKAAVAIYDSSAPVWQGKGVYLQCDVQIPTSEQDIQRGIDAYYGGRHIPHGFDRKNVSDYVGDKPWRIYKAVPYDISTLSHEESLIDGYSIDQRTSAV